MARRRGNTPLLNKPSKLDGTPYNQAIPRLVAQGMHPRAAAAHAGLDPVSWHRWSNRGLAELDRQANTPPNQPVDPDPDEQPYADLVIAVMAAEANLEHDIVTSWRAASQKDWRAGAALLKARFPHQWGDRTEQTTAPTTPPPPTLAEWAAFADQLERRALTAG